MIYLSFVTPCHVVSKCFFNIKVVCVKPKLTFFIGFLAVDVDRFVVFIRVEENAPTFCL